MKEYPYERMLRDCRILLIFEVTNKYRTFLFLLNDNFKYCVPRPSPIHLIVSCYLIKIMKVLGIIYYIQAIQ